MAFICSEKTCHRMSDTTSDVEPSTESMSEVRARSSASRTPHCVSAVLHISDTSNPVSLIAQSLPVLNQPVHAEISEHLQSGF